MAVIQASGLTLVTNRVLFENVDFVFDSNDRVGVVGDNGVGKSTLLKVIAGLAEPTRGAIRLSKVAVIGYVGQTTDEIDQDMPLNAVTVSALPAAELYSSGWRAEVMLDRFNADEETRKTPFRMLSGGWRRIGQIIRALVTEPDLLLLDEPTNSLDLSKTLQLEALLEEELGDTLMLVVSHDRRFLDRVTTATLFQRQLRTRLIRESYSTARQRLDEADRADQVKAERDRREAERLKKSAHNLRQIGISHFSDKALRKSIQIAKRAETILEGAPTLAPVDTRLIELDSRAHSRKPVLSIEKADFKTPDGRALLHVEKLFLTPGQRLVVLGRNGSGKTTFIRTILHQIASVQGDVQSGVRVHPAVIVGATAQHMTHLPGRETLNNYVASTLEVGNQRAPGLLAEAGFPFERQTVQIDHLSAGERARLAFLALRLIKPTLFLLDEPTNDLDIAGQEALEVTLREQEAASILVSHDRALVENVGTRFIVMEGGRAIDVEDPEIFYRALAEDALVAKLVPQGRMRYV